MTTNVVKMCCCVREENDNETFSRDVARHTKRHQESQMNRTIEIITQGINDLIY